MSQPFSLPCSDFPPFDLGAAAGSRWGPHSAELSQIDSAYLGVGRSGAGWWRKRLSEEGARFPLTLWLRLPGRDHQAGGDHGKRQLPAFLGFSLVGVCTAETGAQNNLAQERGKGGLTTLHLACLKEERALGGTKLGLNPASATP